MGYTVYWTRNTEHAIAAEDMGRIVATASQHGGRFNSEIAASAQTLHVNSQGSETFVIHAQHDGISFQFCKTNHYSCDTLVKTLLMYLLSLGAIRISPMTGISKI